MDHSFTCKHRTCLYLVSIPQMAPPLAHRSMYMFICNLLLIRQLQNDERLSWPGTIFLWIWDCWRMLSLSYVSGVFQHVNCMSNLVSLMVLLDHLNTLVVCCINRRMICQMFTSRGRKLSTLWRHSWRSRHRLVRRCFSLFCDNSDGAGSNDCSLLCLSDKGTKSPGNSSSHVVEGKRLRIDEAAPSVNNIWAVIIHTVTTCLENLEMSGNLTAVREMSGILLKVREKCCQRKVAYIFAFIQVFSRSLFCVKY